MTSLVVDIGSGTARAGWSGDRLPSVIREGYTHEGNAPVTRGTTFNWDAVEALWTSLYGDNLKIDAKEHPVMLADSPTITDENRGKMAEILFEKFEVPAYFVSSQSVLSLYSAGRTCGIVLDIGHAVAHSVAIHEGFAYPHTLNRLDLGGGDLTASLADLMEEGSGASAGGAADGRMPVGVYKAIKEQHGRVALDYAAEAYALRCKADGAPTYTLPDGRVITLQNEHLRQAEALFQPALAGCRGHGLADILWETIQVCDADREGGPLHSLPQFVLGVGGTSQMPGLSGEGANDIGRLKKELDVRAGEVRDTYITCLEDAPERHHAAFVGGSIIAGLPSFVENNFVSRAEYLEDGIKAVNKRCC